MANLRKRIDELKKQHKKVNLCPSAPAQSREINVLANTDSFRAKFAAKIEEARHNPNYINFNNRIDLYGNIVNGDISGVPADFISFDSLSDFSAADRPDGFEPDLFMENGKNAGLGLDELHKKGITGKNVKIAIIDQPLADHEEYHGKIKYYEETGCDTSAYGSMHGSCVTSLAVGNHCGIAPDAEVYYFAAPFWDFEKNKDTKVHVAEALKKCIQLNRSLPAGEKICAVSISGCFDESMEGYAEYMKQREEAAKDGLEVITCSIYKEKGLSMNGYNRDMSKDVNQSENIVPIKAKIDQRIHDDWFNPETGSTLLLPCDHRTMASHNGYNQYMHAARGGFSWLPPQAVAMYALAKQADASCTFTHFWQTALKSGVKDEKLNGVALHPKQCIDQIVQEKALRRPLALGRISELS